MRRLALIPLSAEVSKEVSDYAVERVLSLWAFRSDWGNSETFREFVAMTERFQIAINAPDRLKDTIASQVSLHIKIDHEGAHSHILKQSKKVAESWHSERLRMIQESAASDKWEPATVTSDYQHIVERILTPPELAGEYSPPPTESTQTLNIESSEYYISVSGLTLIKELEGYLHQSFDNGKEIGKCCEILRYYQNEINGLILGARAVHSGGLKSIGAKHLGNSMYCV